MEHFYYQNGAAIVTMLDTLFGTFFFSCSSARVSHVILNCANIA